MLCAFSQFLESFASNNNNPIKEESAGQHARASRRHLPLPTGPHTVGCVDLMCDLADDGTFFRLYYPTNEADIMKSYKQWPLWLPRKQYAHGYVHFLKKNKIFGRIAQWLGGDVYVPVLWQAPVLKTVEKFPVVIISHGIGGNRTTLSTYSYELASYGFVVAALEHRDGSASMTMCLTEQPGSSIKEVDDHKSVLHQRSKSDSHCEDCDEKEVDDHKNKLHQRSKSELHQRPKSELHQRPKSELHQRPKSEFHQRSKSEHHPRPKSELHQKSKSELHQKSKSELYQRSMSELHKRSRSDGDCEDNDKKEVPVDRKINFYPSEAKEMRESTEGHGVQVRQRRENRKRSLRHNHSCSEEWRPFKHVEVWDDFDLRNGQMYQRADEISDLLDELISMNEGTHINNALGLAFKTNQFKNRLDISRLAAIGHSFGGAAVLATLTTNPSFKVGISLDGWMHPVDSEIYETMVQPVLLLNMEQFQWEQNVNRMLLLQKSNKNADRPMITLMGACHQSMTDFQFIVPQLMGRFMDVCYTLAPTACMAACVTTSLAFLYKHLDLPLEPKHADVLECKHPHLISGTNVDLTIPDSGPTPP